MYVTGKLSIGYPSTTDYSKTFEKNYLKIAVNILYIKEKETLPLNHWKTYNYINDCKRRKRRMAVSCSEKIICIIIWNNFKT